MIYELKIELFSTDVPSHRTMKVSDRTSFRQLHYIIQTIFDWSGIHPHLFFLHYPNHLNAIGDRKFISHPAFTPYRDWTILDEKKQHISTWMKQPGDSFIYEYFHQFKESQAHLIELVAIHEPTKETIYPLCVEAENLPPKEPFPTRKGMAYSRMDTDNVNSLVHHINHLVKREETIITQPEVDKENYYMAWLEVLATDFFEQRSWEMLSEDQIFSVVDPETETKLFTSVNGADGKEPGLSLFIGEDSFLQLQQSAYYYHQTQNASQAVEQLENFYGIGLLFRHKNDYNQGYWHLSQEENPDKWSSYDNVSPFYFSYTGDDVHPKLLTVKEMRWLILVLEQVSAVITLVKKGLEVPSTNESQAILERVYSLTYKQFVNHEIRLIIK